MNGTSTISKAVLKELYDSGNSMQVISVLLNVNVRKIDYLMNKYHLSKRSRSNALYIKNNRDGDPFLFKSVERIDDAFSFGLGIGLFWGEGMKLNSNGVRLGNSDPDIILYFKGFLKDIFNVKEEKFKYSLQIFGDHNPEKVMGFWARKLEVKKERFGKITVTKSVGKGTYKKKSKYGVLQIAVFNTKLKRLFDVALDYLKHNPHAVVAQLVEHIHGEAQRLSPTSRESGR